MHVRDGALAWHHVRVVEYVDMISLLIKDPPHFYSILSPPQALDDTDVVAYNLQHGAQTVRFVVGCWWLCNGTVTTLESGDVRRWLSARHAQEVMVMRSGNQEC